MLTSNEESEDYTESEQLKEKRILHPPKRKEFKPKSSIENKRFIKLNKNMKNQATDLRNIKLLCRSLIKQHNQAHAKEFVENTQLIREHMIKIRGNRWQEFKEKRTEVVTNYIRAIKQVMLKQELIVKIKAY